MNQAPFTNQQGYNPASNPGFPPQAAYTQPPQSYSQPLPPQQSVAAGAQEVRFYKSSLFFFRSAAGRLESDCRRMTAQGWKVKTVSFVGLNFFWQRVVCCVYEK